MSLFFLFVITSPYDNLEKKLKNENACLARLYNIYLNQFFEFFSTTDIFLGKTATFWWVTFDFEMKGWSNIFFISHSSRMYHEKKTIASWCFLSLIGTYWIPTKSTYSISASSLNLEGELCEEQTQNMRKMRKPNKKSLLWGCEGVKWSWKVYTPKRHI